MFAQGTINVNFKDNMIGFTAGDCVHGSVDVVLKDPIKINDLVLEFVGLERCHLPALPITNPYKYGAKEIICMRVLVQSFTAQLEAGHYTFPFSLLLPDWLPDSLTYRMESDLLTVEYTLRA